MASIDDEAPRTPEKGEDDEEGEGDDEELNPEREVFIRHPSGVIIYKDEIPDLVEAGHIVFQTTGASSLLAHLREDDENFFGPGG